MNCVPPLPLGTGEKSRKPAGGYCHEFDEERPELIFQELLLRLANKINKITQVTIRYPTRKTHSLSTD